MRGLIKIMVEPSKIIKDFIGYIIPFLTQNQWNLQFAKGGPKDPEHPEQSLFTHSVNGIFGLGRLLTFLKKEEIEIRGLDEEVLKKTLGLYILHDLHKVLEKEGKSQFSIPLERIEEEYRKIGLDKIVELDVHLIRAANVHSRSSKQGDILLSSEDSGSLEWLLVRIADSMASMVSQREYSTLWNYLKRLSPKISENYALYYHEVKEIRGVLTNLIHESVASILSEKRNFFPLLFFAAGTLYMGPKFTNEKYQRASFLNLVTERVVEAFTRYGETGGKTLAYEFIRAKNYDFEPPAYTLSNLETLLEIVSEKCLGTQLKVKFPKDDLDGIAKRESAPDGWLESLEKRFKDLLSKSINGTLTVQESVSIPEIRFSISLSQPDQFNKLWHLVNNYLLYIDGILRGINPLLERLDWFIKIFALENSVSNNLKEDAQIFSLGGLGKYTIIIAYHFLTGKDFKDRKAEECRESEVVEILQRKIITPLEKEYSQDRRRAKTLELGYEEDLSKYLEEELFISFDPATTLEKDAFETYLKGRTKDYPKYCFICSRESNSLQRARSGIIDDFVRSYSNKVIPSKEAPQGIYWCPICSFEFTLRKLVGLSMKGDYRASHRINFYILPTYSFTPDHSLIFERILTPIRKMTSLKIRDYSEDNWGLPRIWLERKGFDVDLEEELIDALKKEAERIGDKTWGERLYTSWVSPQPNYFLIVWERALPSSADKEDIPTRTEVWTKALFCASILTGLTGAKVLITEKPFVEFLNSNSFIPTIMLDSPHSMLRTVIGGKDGVSLENLESVLDLSSALWIINSLMRGGRKDKHISELLELISAEPLAGAIFYKAYAREHEGSEPPEYFTKACSILLNRFGGEMMDLAKEIAEKSLEIALPFRGSGRGKFHRFELIFREAVNAVRESIKAIPNVKSLISSGKPIPEEILTEVKTLAIGTLKKAMERRMETRRGEIIVNPRFKSEEEFRVDIEQMISLVVDELFVKRARGSFAKFIDLENSVADGIYYVIDKRVPQEWNKRKAIKSFKEGELSVSEAAQLAGMDKVSFMEELGKQGVSVFNYSSEELEEDLQSIEKAGETR